MAGKDNQHPRIMFISGGLGKGGAEKQLMYMLRSLKHLGAEIQVLSLTEGEFYQRSLVAMGISTITIHGSPLMRILRITRAAQRFHPHFLQATHFYTSLYAGAVGRLTGISSIGAIRGDLYHDLKGTGRRGRWILRLPTVLLANSNNARENALALGISQRRLQVLRNVIDLKEFDRQFAAFPPELLNPDRIRAITVARLIPVKRLERFLTALAQARAQVPAIQGVIVGSGAELAALRKLATELGLEPDNPSGTVRFLGERSDIPQLLAQSKMFVLTSDREGFPNVLLEAMAASLPIVATPAGETRDLVQDGSNGYLVPFDDPEALTKRLVELAQSPNRRNTMGNEGRRMVERLYDFSRLENNLIEIYRAVAAQANNHAAMHIFENDLPSGSRKAAPLS